ncbi:MAG: ABC transporter permease [Oscillospiraceae bacterium]|nr:ABC transporter permease [Oscillospiraceae bacterium]
MKNGFSQRLGSMLKVDFRRMLKSKTFYILLACALVIPILMTVMMTMMDGSVSVNPQTGEETIMEGPENTWQNIGTLPGGEAMGGNEIFMMCNINMMFMLVAVFICPFVSEDFRSGFAKNLFTIRAKKGDYVVSKTVSGVICGSYMLIAYFVGTMLGGAISGLSFDLHGLTMGNIAMCMVAKIFLMSVFVSIDVIVSVAAKQKAWLCLCGSLGAGMLLFMMVSLITPLGSTLLHVIGCLAGGILFGVGLGVFSNKILNKTSLV